MKKPVFYRILFYVIGLLVLALGLTLNTAAENIQRNPAEHSPMPARQI